MQANFKDITDAIAAAGASAYTLAALALILIVALLNMIWKSSARKTAARGEGSARAERQHHNALLVTVAIVGLLLLFVVTIVALREPRREPQVAVHRQEMIPPTATHAPEPAPKTYAANISSVPHGARIYIDGNDWGLTPNTVKLPAGRHEVRLVLAGYETLQDVLEVRNQPVVYAPELLKRR